MRHKKSIKKLSRPSGHRKALLRNLVKALFANQRIQTTLVKARSARQLAEKLITFAKIGDVAHARLIYRYVNDRSIVSLLLKEIAPRFSNRTGGYTRIIKMGKRHGDNAQMVLLELTELKITDKSPPRAKAKEKQEAPESVSKVEKEEKIDKKQRVESRETIKKSRKRPKFEKTHFLKGLRKFFRRKSPSQ